MSKTNIHKQTVLNTISRLAGRLANATKPRFFVRSFIKYFIRKYKINLDNYIVPNYGFKSFNQFFTRKIKPEARPIGSAIVSPADGEIFDFGPLSQDTKMEIKGKLSSLLELGAREKYNFNSFAVIYLSPSDYHRVHAPFDLNIDRVKYVPGRLKSVSEKTFYRTKNLYSTNERIIISGSSEYGRFVIVMVGALIVGKIKLSFNQLTSNQKGADVEKENFEIPIKIEKGKELGFFEMGSTVVLAIENTNLSKLLKPEFSKVRMGETIAE